MTRAIWKFQLNTVDWVEFPMPAGARILDLQVQHGYPCIWAEVDADSNALKVIRKFRTYGTGHPLDEVQQTYVGSYQLAEGALVFHVYEQEAPR